MSKKHLRKVILVVAPLCIFTMCVLLLNYSLDARINANYKNSIGHPYALAARDNGIALLRHSAQKGDIILMGSSELGVKTDNNPGNRFPNSTVPYDITLTGHAKVQSLESTIKLGAISGSIQNNRIVLVVSLQWFMGGYIAQNALLSNFSELQFDETMNNPAISNSTKQTLCNRVRRFTKNSGFYEQTNIYTMLHAQNSSSMQPAIIALNPYFSLRHNFLILQDKFKAEKALITNPLQPISKIKQASAAETWSSLELQAGQQGKAACTNNSYYINNDYYSKCLAPNMNELKNSLTTVGCQYSGEWDDLKLFFDVCQQIHIKPYIVMMTANGGFYDYMGLSREKRLGVYNRVEKMAKAYGLDVLNLKDKEYVPYFYQDDMHLGWKGWLYVDEQISKHFS